MQEPATSYALEIDVPGLFQALFMKMEEGVALYQVICDGAGRPTNYRVIDVNAQYERVFGRRRAELVGKLANEAYQEREPPHLVVYGKVALEGQPARFEEFLPAVGRHFEVSVSSMGSGYFSTVLSDVTERRLQEVSSSSSLEDEGFLERSQIVGRLGSFRMEVTSGRWVSSRGLDDLLGIDPDFEKDVSGWFNLVHPHDQEEVGRYMTEEVLEKGQPFDRRYRILRHRDGALRWVHGRAAAEKDEVGVTRYLIGTVQDITETVQKEQALESKFEELDRIFSLTLEMLSISTAEGRLLRVNAAWERVLGWSVAELEGSLYTDLIHSDDLSSTLGAMAELASGRDVIDFTNRCLCKDGSYRFLEWRSVPAGGVVYAGARDVSERERNRAERHRLEQQLRQSQKMESVGLLAGGVAHDFNNLLTVILGCTDELMDQVVRDDPSRGLLSEVDQAGRRAAELTRQLLAFSRQQVLQPRVVDLNEIVLGVTNMLRRMLGERVELVWRPGQTVDRVFADPGQLEQIIVNLAVNARDAMPEGGQLLLESYSRSSVPADLQSKDLEPRGYVVLAVHDTGVGMDDVTRERIFEPFFTTKGELGTGLGLSTVYGIVKQSGGQVTVVSQPGHGTTFEVYLPAAAATSMRRSPSGILGGGRLGGHESVLLVEDEPSVRRILKKILVGAGYLVLEAANADEALRLNAECRGNVDVLLTDVVMPGKTGRQLAERMLLEQPSLKVIYMSGYAPSEAPALAGLKDRHAFIQKPIRPVQLLSKLREVLDCLQALSA
jgi:two-component system cell cycle sensor histidine kinase/response regulator CckA